MANHSKALGLSRCRRHPHYRGKGPIPADCSDCLKIFQQLAMPRQFVRPTKVIPSKKAYARHAKHRHQQQHRGSFLDR